MYSILALDPGSKNFAWSYVADSCWQTGMLSIVTGKPEEIVTHFRPQLTALLERFRPDEVVIERFMTRQRSSLNNEIINVLIGAVLSTCIDYGILTTAITSSVWKSKFRRDAGCPSNDVKLKGKSDHECDAVGMAAFKLDDPILRSLLAVSALLTSVERVHRTRKQWMLAKEVKQLWNVSHVKSLISRMVEQP